MSNIDELYDWLAMAFSGSFARYPETYYYDGRYHVFFSIHMADYLLLNEDFSVDENPDSTYAPAVMQLLSDRITRIERMDPEIVLLPLLSVPERKEIMQEFIGRQQEPALVELLQQRMKNQDGSQRFDFYFGEEATAAMKTAWWNLKKQRMISSFHEFMRVHDIDPEMVTVWNWDETQVISIKLK